MTDFQSNSLMPARLVSWADTLPPITRIFTFPFVTIEDVDVVDASHIVVGNDNNLPYSSGRAIGKQDDNELVLIEAADFLKAK